MKRSSYRDLVVWQKGMDLIEKVYRASRRFPEEERYGLTAQMRRAAVSIPSNTAEGHGRRSLRDFLRFLAIARGSTKELETQILIARRLGYLNDENEAALISLTDQVSRLIIGLASSLKKGSPNNEGS